MSSFSVWHWVILLILGGIGYAVYLIVRHERAKRTNSSAFAAGALSHESHADGLYEIVGEELRSNSLKQGLWVKAFAEADGDNAKSQAAYIRYRVAELQAARSSDVAKSAPIQQAISNRSISGWKKTTPRVVILFTWLMAVGGVFGAFLSVLGQDFDTPQSPESRRFAGQAILMAVVGIGILSAVYARRRKSMWFLIGAGVVIVALALTAFVGGIVRASKLDALLDKNPVFRALKASDPKAHDVILKQFQEGTKNKESAEQLIARAHSVLLVATLKFIPLASDDALVSYYRTQARYVEIMSKRRPELCYDVAIRKTKRPPSGLITDEQKNQELNALADLIRSSVTPLPQRPHVDPEVVVKQIAVRIKEKYGNNLENFNDPLAPGIDKSKVCEEAIIFHNEVLRLQTNEAGSVIRYLYAP